MTWRPDAANMLAAALLACCEFATRKRVRSHPECNVLARSLRAVPAAHKNNKQQAGRCARQRQARMRRCLQLGQGVLTVAYGPPSPLHGTSRASSRAHARQHARRRVICTSPVSRVLRVSVRIVCALRSRCVIHLATGEVATRALRYRSKTDGCLGHCSWWS